MSLAERSVRSVTWNTFASLVTFPVSLLQSILLARLLPVDYFGIYAGINAIINLSSVFFEFGLNAAFLHRSEETQDETRAINVYFFLRLILITVWLIVVIGAGLIFFTDGRRLVMIFLAVTNALTFLAAAPEIILVRRVEHRRMAIIDLSSSLISALTSLWIAYFYRSIWALLVSSLITLIISFLGLRVFRPVARMRPRWDARIGRYLLNFGFKSLSIQVLDSALENIDNLWTSLFLGDRWLGYYSRAYRFAIYPRALLTVPINQVSLGMFAELKSDRSRLSKAFFRVSFLLSSFGSYLAGLLGISATLLILLFLGEKWLPMVGAFRLLLLFLVLDPLRMITSSLLVAIGKPEKVTRIRLIQFAILTAGLFIFGMRLQIVGAAIAVNLMVIIGVILSFIVVRNFVDISTHRLFLPQITSILAGLAIDRVILNFLNSVHSNWFLLVLRIFAFSLGFLMMMILLEGRTILRSLEQIAEVIPASRKILAWLKFLPGHRDSGG